MAVILFIFTWVRLQVILGFDSEILSIIKNPRVIHKIGELILLAPFAYIHLSSFTKSKKEINRLIKWSALPMFLGGVLNFYSWMELRGEVFWAPFCLVIFSLGVFAVPISRKYFLKRAAGELN